MALLTPTRPVERDALAGLADLGRRVAAGAIAGTPAHSPGLCTCGGSVRQCCDSLIGSPHRYCCPEFGDVPDARRLRGENGHDC